jgi:hypothetical protein
LDDDLRFNLAGSLAGLITHLLFGVLILNLLPQRIHQMVIQIHSGWRVWVRTFAVGLFLSLGLVALSFLSTFAIHTMPVIILLLIGFLFASAVGMVAIAFTIGKALLNRAEWLQRSPILTLAFGILLLFSLTRIPYLGGISLLLLWFVGTGISILTRFGSGEAWHLQSLMEEMET